MISDQGDLNRNASTEASCRVRSARALLDAMDEGRWPRRASDLELVSRLLQRAARFTAMEEEMAACYRSAPLPVANRDLRERPAPDGPARCPDALDLHDRARGLGVPRGKPTSRDTGLSLRAVRTALKTLKGADWLVEKAHGGSPPAELDWRASTPLLSHRPVQQIRWSDDAGDSPVHRRHR